MALNWGLKAEDTHTSDSASFGDVARQLGAGALDAISSAASAARFSGEQGATTPEEIEEGTARSRPIGAAARYFADSLREGMTKGGKDTLANPEDHVLGYMGMTALGAAPYIAGGIGAGMLGSAVGGPAGAIAAGGAVGAAAQVGMHIDGVMQTTDAMTDEELYQASPVFRELFGAAAQEYGDQRRASLMARKGLHEHMVTTKDLIVQGLSGALPGMVGGQVVGKVMPGKNAVTRALMGVGETGASMGIMAGATEEGRQSAELEAGMRQGYDFGKIAGHAWQGAWSSAPLGVAGGVLGHRGKPKEDTKPPPKPGAEAVDPIAPDSAQAAALDAASQPKPPVEPPAAAPPPTKPAVDPAARLEELKAIVANEKRPFTEAEAAEYDALSKETTPQVTEGAEPTVAKTPATLAVQQQALADGLRPVQFFPPGTEAPKPPNGIKAAKTKGGGVYHYDPKQVTREQLNAAIREGRVNELLELGPVTKAEAVQRIQEGEPPAAVVERTPDGTEVKAAAGTAETAPEQVKAFEETKLPGSTVSVETPADVIGKRLAGADSTPPRSPASAPLPAPTVTVATVGGKPLTTKAQAAVKAGKKPKAVEEKPAGDPNADTGTEPMLRAETDVTPHENPKSGPEAAPGTEVATAEKPLTPKAQAAVDAAGSPPAASGKKRSKADAERIKKFGALMDATETDLSKAMTNIAMRQRLEAMEAAAKELGINFQPLSKSNPNGLELRVSHEATEPQIVFFREAAKLLAEMRAKGAVSQKRINEFLTREYRLRVGEAIDIAEVKQTRRLEGESAMRKGKVDEERAASKELDETEELHEGEGFGSGEHESEVIGSRERTAAGEENPLEGLTIQKMNRPTKEEHSIEPTGTEEGDALRVAAAAHRRALDELAGLRAKKGELSAEEKARVAALTEKIPDLARAEKAAEAALHEGDEARAAAAKKAAEEKADSALKEKAAEVKIGEDIVAGKDVTGTGKVEAVKVETREITLPNGKKLKVKVRGEGRKLLTGEVPDPAEGAIGYSTTVRDVDLDYSASVSGDKTSGFANMITRRVLNTIMKAVGDLEVHVIRQIDLDYLHPNEKPGTALGAYDFENKVILISNKMVGADGRINAHAFVHEALHGALHDAIKSSERIHKNIEGIKDLVERSLSDAERKLFDYAFTDVHEFASEALSNPAFQDRLASIKLTPELAQRTGLGRFTGRVMSAWDGLVEVVRSFIGRGDQSKAFHSALEGMLRVTEEGTNLGRMLNRKPSGESGLRPMVDTKLSRAEAFKLKAAIKRADLDWSFDASRAAVDRGSMYARNMRPEADHFQVQKEFNAGWIDAKLGRLPSAQDATYLAGFNGFKKWAKENPRPTIDQSNLRSMIDTSEVTRQGKERARDAGINLGALGRAAQRATDTVTMLAQRAGKLGERFGEAARAAAELGQRMDGEKHKILARKGGALEIATEASRLSRQNPAAFAKAVDLAFKATEFNVNLGPKADNAHLGKDATKGWQAKAKLPEMQAEYAALARSNPELTKWLEKAVEFGREERNAQAMDLITNTLKVAGFDNPALAKRVFEKGLTDIEREHMKGTIVGHLDAARDLKKMDGWYFPLSREGDYVVSGRRDFAAGVEALGQKHISMAPDGTVQVMAPDLGLSQTAARRAAEKFASEHELHLSDARLVWVDKADPTKVTEKEQLNAVPAYRLKMQDRHVEFHKTEAEARRAAERLREEGLVDVYEDRKAQNPNAPWSGMMVSQMEALIGTLRNRPGFKQMSEAQQGMLERSMQEAVVRMLPGTRLQKHSLGRRNVAGYSRDIVQSLSDYGEVSAGYRAKLRYQDSIDAALKTMSDEIVANREDGNSIKRREIFQELENRLYKNKPVESNTFWGNLTRRMAQISMLDKLAGPSFHVINSTEPWMTAMPVMVGRHNLGAISALKNAYNLIGAKGGFAAGLKDTARAFRENLGFTKYDDLFKAEIRRNASPEEAARLEGVIDHLVDTNLFGHEAGMELQRVAAPSPSFVGRAIDKADLIARQMGSAVEAVNRATVGLSAYRLEYAKNGGDHAAALRYSHDIVHDTMGNYSASNAAPIFNTNVGRVALQFKKFAQKTYYLLGKIMGNAIRGDKEAMKQFAGLMFTHAMVAGALGLPLEPIKVALLTSNALGASPYNYDDFEHLVRSTAAGLFGVRGGEMVTRGVPRALGVDVSERMSMASLLTFGQPKTNKAQDMKAWLFDTMAGAPVGTALNGILGTQDLVAGRFGDASDKLIPIKAVRDARRAVAGLMGPKTDSRGRETFDAFTPAEAAIQAIGFQPSSRARGYEAKRAAYNAIGDQKAEQQKLVDKWVNAAPADKATAFKAVQRYNAVRGKDEQITPNMLASAAKTREKYSKENILGMTPTKRTKPLLERLEATYIPE